MFLLDYIIIVIIVISFFLGLLRGFYQELITIVFFLFNFYFFSKYNYFLSFFKDSIQNILLIHNVLIPIMIIFFLL